MSIVSLMDQIVKWSESKICQRVAYKKPNEDEASMGYDHQLVHPNVFPLFTPTKDRLPSDKTFNSPSICIQIQDGSINLIKREGKVKINLALSIWNPGLHVYGDLLIPQQEENGKISYSTGSNSNDKEFIRNTEGWRDIWNFVDVCIDEIKKARFENGINIDSNDGISYGSYTEDGNYLDFYPYFLAWVSFSVNYNATETTSNSLL